MELPTQTRTPQVLRRGQPVVAWDIEQEERLTKCKKEKLSLKSADTRGRDQVFKELWLQAEFAVHIQDGRLTDAERAVIAAIGRRLYGRRSVV